MEAVAVILAVAVLLLVGVAAWAMRSRGRDGGGFDVERGRIDERLNRVNDALDKVSQALDEGGRREASLSTQLGEIGRQTSKLTDTTEGLRRVLSSAQARGQWGERMAEDILRRAGLLEGTNYRKQVTQAEGTARPDFTFFLPDDRVLNMDVKFPLDNYVRSLEARGDIERRAQERDFLRDVRRHIKALATKEYVDPEGGTADYVLLFIPNEAVFRFIHEVGPQVFDEALDSRVVCCTPLTLFAMLALIRQASDTLATRQAAEEIVGLLGRFNQQWGRFGETLDKLGRSIQSMSRNYDALSGTRRKALQRPLDRIEALREQRHIHIAPGEPGDDGFALEEAGDEGENGED
jgi:DNA recombination protein RmuC